MKLNSYGDGKTINEWWIINELDKWHDESILQLEQKGAELKK